jgi:glycosyltransferase involved in cell wall biosynthesis
MSRNTHKNTLYLVIVDISVIIPVYNEAQTLRETGNLFTQVLNSSTFSYELIFVNDHSTDNSPSVLEELSGSGMNIHFISHPTNLGKGAAIRSGLQKARGTVILFGDADMELDPMQCLELVQPIIDMKAEMVNGSRYLQKDHQKDFRSFANKLYGSFFRMLTSSTISDFACGYKAAKREKLLEFNLKENGFGIEAELMMKACRKKMKILELAVTYNQRTKKQGKKLGNIDALKILLVLFKYRFSN